MGVLIDGVWQEQEPEAAKADRRAAASNALRPRSATG